MTGEELRPLLSPCLEDCTPNTHLTMLSRLNATTLWWLKGVVKLFRPRCSRPRNEFEPLYHHGAHREVGWPDHTSLCGQASPD